MPKFEVGDRVKCVLSDVDDKPEGNEHGIVGQIYTVKSCGDMAVGLWLEGIDDRPVGETRFELYAKGGDFVVGDSVVHKNGSDIMTVTRTEGNMVCTRHGGLFLQGHKSLVRLATADEIAAADPNWSKEDILAMPKTPPVNVNKTTDHRTEIPAADFDFSTIKAGDEVVIRFKVIADGLTQEESSSDRFVKVQQPDFGRYFYRPSAFHSVIPAPKPKTLRDRAIEAAGVKMMEDPNWAIESVIDAVLAEIEKGDR